MTTLIKFERDWADEFQCEQILLFEGTVEEAKAAVHNTFFDESNNEDYFSFGSNEGFERDELDPNEDFTYTELTDAQADTMRQLFGNNTFGTGILGYVEP